MDFSADLFFFVLIHFGSLDKINPRFEILAIDRHCCWPLDFWYSICCASINLFDSEENFLRQWVKGTLEYITLEACGRYWPEKSYAQLAAILPKKVYFAVSMKRCMWLYMGVSENGGTPKSSILISFPLFSPSILGCFPPIFGNTHISAYIHWQILNPGDFMHALLAVLITLLEIFVWSSKADPVMKFQTFFFIYILYLRLPISSCRDVCLLMLFFVQITISLQSP